MSEVNFQEMPDGRRIAYRYHPGQGPLLVFLPGYMSDMDGGKATSLFAEAQEQSRACLLLDYSGCGRSSGDFADGTFTAWREEVLALIKARQAEDGAQEVLLVGSSMGGWLMLLVGEALGEALIGIIGIAAAPDFTQWGYSTDQCAEMAAGKTVYEDNPYGPDPTPTHPSFFADAEAQLRLTTDIPITCPVHLLHGQRDADVPWEISLKLAQALRSDAVQVTLIKDGDHRLSRDSDIAMLKAAVASFYQGNTA
ncbi:MAG: alpha/beta hydrolase [Pseudomonadota bacterium]